MEDDLTATVPFCTNFVDMAKAATASIVNESSQSKEEGELSSDVGGDAECHEAGSVSHSADCDAAQMEAVDTVTANKSAQDTKADKFAGKLTSLTDAASKACQQMDHHKNPERTRVPFVISFSDDDSGSNSDESRHNTSVSRDHTEVVDRSRKRPVSSVQKSQKAEEAKLMSAKPSLSRSYVSTMCNVNGTISRKGGQIRGYKNALNFKKGAERSHSRKFNIHINTRKQQLQDLRQLIAFRESQLKVKTSQQTNSTAPVKPSNPLKRLCSEASIDELQSHMTDSVKKRPKTGEPQSNLLGIDRPRNMHFVHQTSTSGKSVSQINVENCIDNSDNSCKVVSQRTSHHAFVMPQNHDKKQGPIASANPCGTAKGGAHIALDSFVSGRNVKATIPIFSYDTNNASGKKDIDKMERSSMREINCINAQDMRMSVQNRCVSGEYLMETSDQNQIKPSQGVIKVHSDDRTRDSALHALDTGQQATTNNSSFVNGLDELSMMKCKNGDVKSLLDVEDLLDKELEEAQEHRRKCEIEERNALTAYRKAQRALVEASARCSQIYSKRELFSAQLRSRMMENPNFFFAPSNLDNIGGGLNPNSISDFNVHPIPTSSCEMQGALGNSKQGHHEFASLNNASQSDKHVDGQNLVSSRFGEPDGCSSKAHKEYDVLTGGCHPSNGLSQSDDEDGESQYFRSIENLSGKASDINGATERDINHGSEKQVSSDGPQDSLLLEASLRSQLFEKLKMKKLAKKERQIMEPVLESRNEHNISGMNMETDTAYPSSPESRNDEQSNPEDVNKEEVPSKLPIQIRSQVDISCSESATPPVIYLTHCSLPLEGQQKKILATVLCPTIKSAFIHMKVLQSPGVQQSPPTRTDALAPDEDTEDVDQSVHDQSVHDQSKKMGIGFITCGKASQGLFFKQAGYYSCNFAIDASKPLCMYELRGKCNNDECSWQHIRDYACGNRENDTNKDYEFGKKPEIEVCANGMLSKSLVHLVLVPPTYIVGSDVLKHDSQSYTSTTAQGYGNCWQKCFSYFLVLSSLCPAVMLSNEPFLHGTEARIVLPGGWNRQSSYFRSRNVMVVDQYYEDAAQSLEVALHNFNQEANRSKKRFEALNVLARAIETNQSSVVLWIVYLLIYYSNQKSIGKDDLFHYAVENNKESYELWILFINSRVRLDDRLAAYQAALSTLTCVMSASNGDAFLASQCILDILLQMMDNLCMSGNFGKAIEMISGVFSSSKSSDDSIQMSIRDTITCLEFSDKVSFWVCCVYLVVYKKLPDPVVHSFELWKEPVVLDWPDAQVAFEEKLEASSLMELFVDSLAVCVDHESLENEKNLRAVHVFAVNHVRCVSVLKGSECTMKLLEKYIELYPSCVELVLMSARSEYHMAGLSFDGFEDALRNGPHEGTGKQCIWNQYFECALQCENIDLVKELMDRWIHSVCQAQESSKGISQSKDVNGAHDPLQSASVSDFCTRFSSDDPIDKVFGMLNLSLYKRLQNDYSGSRFALECALKVASADNFQHCFRELTFFMLNNGIHHHWHDKVNSVLDILNVSLTDDRALSASEPLSRSFIQKIKKPIVRQLVSKLLKPVSVNFCLMNLVLEVWYGLLLLPQIQDKLIDLVDYVEAMMEVLPSNYLLSMAVCKLLKKKSPISGKEYPSTSFWASSLLVNALFHAVPIAPEYCWVEAVDVLRNLACFDTTWESFHKKALSVYPFSIRLWRSYLSFGESAGCAESVKAAAQERGIEV